MIPWSNAVMLGATLMLVLMFVNAATDGSHRRRGGDGDWNDAWALLAALLCGGVLALALGSGGG